MDAIDKLLHISPGNSTTIEGYTLIIYKCADHYQLAPYDPQLYDCSEVLPCMCKVITRKELQSADPSGKYILGTHLLHDKQCIIIFIEPEEFFQNKPFENAREFYDYCLFADKYGLNIPYICDQHNRMNWFLSIKEKQKALWRNNSILLENVEQRSFNKLKFPTVAIAAPAPYPVGNTQVPRPVALNISTPEFLSQGEFVILVDTLLRNNADDFVAKLVAILGTSIEYCHHVFTNPDVIKLVKGLPTFEASAYYAYRVLYLEELTMYARRGSPGRFIFNSDVIKELPNFVAPYSKSPYLPVNIKSCDINSSLVLPAYIPGRRGVYSMDEFKQRVKIYTQNALEFIEWDLPNAKTALNGSVITACAMITPLEKCFESVEKYFDEYYPCKANIRVHVNKEKVQHLYTYLSDDSESDESSEEEDTNTQGGINHRIGFSDIDLMVACNWDEFDSIAQKHFDAIKKVHSNVTMELVPTENKYKYMITGLNRIIDIFHVNDIPSVIIKYHLDCVRAWYDGTTLWCFPSFLISAKTSLNTDIRWTSNRKDVRDIVLKYFQRGFGTIINNKDRQNIINYIDNSNDWPTLRPPGGIYADRRYWARPLFHENLRDMFNPSHSRYGIHRHIQTQRVYIELPKIEISRRKHYPEFRAKSRQAALLPSLCPSLAPYL